MNDRALENSIAAALEAAGFPNGAGRIHGIPLSVRIATTVYDDGFPPMSSVLVHRFAGWFEGRASAWEYAWCTTVIGDFTVAEVAALYAGQRLTAALRADELAGKHEVANG